MQFDDLKPSGRKQQGPASDLVEYTDPRVNVYQSLIFHQWYRRHRLLNHEVERILPFLEAPAAPGVLELAHWDRDRGVFTYRSGDLWTLLECLRQARKTGEPMGVRAGLELAFLGTVLCDEASRAAQAHGVPAHGNINPLRVLLNKSGEVHLLGYGIGQVEMITYLESHDPETILPDESYLYTPPERIEMQREAVDSDLFSLSMVALECMLGEPVYVGTSTEIRAAAMGGLAERRLLYRSGNRLPKDIEEVFVTVLKHDRAQRYRDPNDFLTAIRQLMELPLAKGPTLREFMIRFDPPDRPKPERRAVVAEPRRGDEPDEEATPASRWGAPARGGGRAEARELRRSGATRSSGGRRAGRTQPEPEPAPPPREVSRSGRRQRGSVRTTEAPAPEPASDRASLRQSGTRRSARTSAADLRRSAGRPPRDTRRSTADREAGGRGEPPAREPRRREAPPEAPPPAPRESRSRPEREAPSPDRISLFPRGDVAGTAEKYTVRVDGADHSVKLDPEETLACSTARLVDLLCPTPVDPTGRLSGWYRLAQGDDLWLGDARTRVLDAAVLVELEFVKNKAVLAQIQVDGGQTRELEVGLAVHAGFLLAWLKHDLGLTEADWTLYVEGRPLDAWQILDDYEPKDGVVIELKRRLGRSRR